MDLRLDRIVFGRQPERVEAHRLKHFKTLHFLESGITIARAVIIPVPDMQFRAGRVRKHFQNVVFFIRVLFVENIFFGFLPALLPFAFDGFHIHNKKTSSKRTKRINFSS